MSDWFVSMTLPPTDIGLVLSIVPLCDFFRWPASLPFAGMNAAVISQTTVNVPSILFTMFLRVSVSDCSSAPSPLDIERPEL